MGITEIIIALIAAAGGFAGTVIGIATNTKLVTYRLEQLEDRVNAHNMVVSRTYEVEKRLDLQQEQIKVLNHRVGDLEEELK